MVGRTASGVRTGQTGEREPSRQSLRAPKAVAGKRAVRRILTSDYKLSVLAEDDVAVSPANAALCFAAKACTRRSSPTGDVSIARAPSEGGRGAPSMNEVARLRAKNERLKVKLAKAEAIIEVQGKVRTTTTRRRHRRRRGRRARPGRGSRACLPGVGPLESDALSATPHPTATRPAGTTTSLASGTHTEPGR